MQVTPDFSTTHSPLPAEETPKEMLSIDRSSSQLKVRINSSSLSLILTCLRKSNYVLLRNLRAKTQSPALVFGTAIHKALEVFYSHPKEERVFPTNFAERAKLMAFGTDPEEEHFLFTAIQEFVLAAQPLSGLPDNDKRSIPGGIWTLTHYFETYLHDPYIVYCDESGPITERTFDLVIHETPELQVTLFGTIDVVLENRANGSIIPCDHKTASQLGTDFFNRLKPNHQYSAYILGAQKVLNLDTQNFLVNALQVKPKPVTARGSKPNFTRQITSRTPSELEEFKDSVMYSVRNILHAQETGNFPMGHVDACAQWGGCQFLEVCSAPSNLRENIIESKFN